MGGIETGQVLRLHGSLVRHAVGFIHLGVSGGSPQQLVHALRQKLPPQHLSSTGRILG
jgi:hypothetical protein